MILQNRFYTVCVKGYDYKKFKRLLNNRFVDPFINDKALTVCVMQNNVSFIREFMLVRKLNNSNTVFGKISGYNDFNNILEAAIVYGSIEAVKELMNFRTYNSFTISYLIFLCAKYNQIEIAKILLDIWEEDTHNKNIILYDITKPNILSQYITSESSELAFGEIIKHMIKLKFDFAYDHNSILKTFVKNNFISLVKILLDYSSVSSMFKHSYIFSDVCNDGNLDMLDLLLKDGRYNPCFNDNEALKIACKRGYLNIVKRLLEDNRVKDIFMKNQSSTYRIVCDVLNIDIFKYFVDNHNLIPSFKNNYMLDTLLFNILSYNYKSYIPFIKYLLQQSSVIKNLNIKQKNKLEKLNLIPDYKSKKNKIS